MSIHKSTHDTTKQKMVVIQKLVDGDMSRYNKKKHIKRYQCINWTHYTATTLSDTVSYVVLAAAVTQLYTKSCLTIGAYWKQSMVQKTSHIFNAFNFLT